MALRLVQFIVVVVALLACVPSTRAASGRIGFNGGCGGDICGFDAIGLLDSGGVEVTVGGHITCDPRLQEGGWEVLASVTQEATLVVARGIVTGVCHGTTQHGGTSRTQRSGAGSSDWSSVLTLWRLTSRARPPSLSASIHQTPSLRSYTRPGP